MLRWSPIPTVPLVVPLLFAGLFGSSDTADRRTVDRVIAGDARSESLHGFAGHDTRSGVDENGSYRETTAWFGYSLAIFEDTDVTLRLSFKADTVSRGYNVVVEDSLIASRGLDPVNQSPTAGSESKSIVHIDAMVPFALTKGKNFITVTIRSREGLTPGLREISTIQDHNEYPAHFSDFHASNATCHPTSTRNAQ